jgi:hypothetical protein
VPNTTVFLLDIINSNSLHGPVRELHQDNGISNQKYWQGPYGLYWQGMKLDAVVNQDAVAVVK